MIAIDLGSNTIRFLACDFGGKPLWETQFVVRTAENLGATGAISNAALERIRTAIETAKTQFDFEGNKIAAVATEAFRRAKNRSDALRFLREKSGVEFRVISSEEEAELTACAAVESARKLAIDAPHIVLDIGGASSEAVYFDSALRESISLPIGIVTLSEMRFSREDTRRYLRTELKKLAPFSEAISRLEKPKTMLAAAGAPTTLAAIKSNLNYSQYDKNVINGITLSIDEILALENRLSKLPIEELEILTGRDRGDLVIVGAAMLAEFMRVLGFNEARAIDEGLREGVMARALGLI